MRGSSKIRTALGAAFPLGVGLLLLTLIVWSRGRTEASPSPSAPEPQVAGPTIPEFAPERPVQKTVPEKTDAEPDELPGETWIAVDEEDDSTPKWLRTPPTRIKAKIEKAIQEFLAGIAKKLRLNDGQIAWMADCWKIHLKENEDSRTLGLAGTITREQYRLRLAESIELFYDRVATALTETQAAGLEKFRETSREGHERLRKIEAKK